MPKKQRQRYKQASGVQSKQEELILAAYPQLKFKPQHVPYVMECDYHPDFRLGVEAGTGRIVYLECKEWLQVKDVPKYRAILACNKHIVIAFLIYKCTNAAYVALMGLPKSQVWIGRSRDTLPAHWFTQLETTHD